MRTESLTAEDAEENQEQELTAKAAKNAKENTNENLPPMNADKNHK